MRATYIAAVVLNKIYKYRIISNRTYGNNFENARFSGKGRQPLIYKR